jgi:hypothetical protein
VIACRGPSLGLFEVLERGLAPREGVDGVVVEQGVGAQRRRHTRGEPCSRVCMHSLGLHKRTMAGSQKNVATGCCWELPGQVEGRPEAWSEAKAGVYPRDEDKGSDCGRLCDIRVVGTTAGEGQKDGTAYVRARLRATRCQLIR